MRAAEFGAKSAFLATRRLTEGHREGQVLHVAHRGMPEPRLMVSSEDHPAGVDGAEPHAWRLHSPLTHRVVVTAALYYIDEHGLGDLTMRRLGASLGVEAMALYRYVRSKEQLLNDVAMALVESMTLDANRSVVTEGEWQAVVRGVAHAVRRTALAHPHAFPLVVAIPREAAWLRPPLASLDGVESFMRCLREGGLSDEACVQTYEALTTFLVGHLQIEVDPRRVGHLRHAAPYVGVEGISGATHPVLSSLRPRISEHRFAFEFEEALETLIDHAASSLQR